MEDSAEVKPTTPEQQAQQQEAAPVDTAAAPSTTDASQPPVDQTAASQPVQSEGEVVATTNGEATISSDAAATPAAPQDAPIADATTTGDATAAATAVAQGEATNETREMSPTDPAAPNTAPEAVAAPAAGPLNFNFLTLKDLYTKPTVVLTEDADVTFAKSFLKAQTGAVGNNVYDHMTSIVMRILETRPGNPVDMFEMISSDLKRSKFQVENPESPSTFKRVTPTSDQVKLSDTRIQLMTGTDHETDVENGANGELPDVLELSKLWEWAGVSFGQEETFLLFLSLKKLVEEKNLKNVRLWGKIMGTEKNYIVVEGELKDNSSEEQEEEATPAEEAKSEDVEKAAVDDAGLPKIKVKTVPPVPKESHSGLNKHVYYVCNFAGGEWNRLPDVIPDNLQISRKIRKYFTGNLNKQINSYPAFNGTEAQYLRCQIARISSSTVASPTGYYTTDPEEEEKEDGDGVRVIINSEFEALTNDNLMNLSNWVHHTSYILPQGRTSWKNPYLAARAGAGEAEEEEDEDAEGSQAGDNEKNEGKNLEPEQGPALLTPLSVDEESGDLPSWNSRHCAKFLPSKYNPVTIRSSQWPGASIVALNDKFTNIYIGDGLKSLVNPAQSFVLPNLPLVQKEYAPGEGVIITESVDPSVEEEKAFEDSQKKNSEEAKGADGEEEEHEEPEDD